ASMSEVLSPHRWALIGASAIRCRLPLPRPTLDVDFAVAASPEAVFDRMRAGGWLRHPSLLHRWQRGAASVDILPATDEDVLVGFVRLEEGLELSVVGFDLAYAETDPVLVQDGLAVPVPRLPILALLKIVAWQERNEREKDLEDLVFILDGALPEEDERRWSK